MRVARLDKESLKGTFVRSMTLKLIVSVLKLKYTFRDTNTVY